MEYFRIKRRMIELDAMLKAKNKDEDQVIQKELDQLKKANPMAWLEVQ